LLWALNEQASSSGNARITAYSLQDGKPVATHEVPLTEAQKGVPAAGPRPQGSELPPPMTIPQPNTPRDAPQLAQIVAGKQSLVGVIHQPAKEWGVWSRVVQIGLHSNRVAWSSPLSGCNLTLNTLGRSGQLAVGSCDLLGRSGFDQYAIKKSDAVFVSTQTGSTVAILPLKTDRPTLSLAVDDSVSPAIAAIYDQRATVRLLPLP
jgi:hypothetical protein